LALIMSMSERVVTSAGARAEGAAVIVQGDAMTAIGSSVVLITDGGSHHGLPYYVPPKGARFDLAAWKVA
jgi:hypothetical protein